MFERYTEKARRVIFFARYETSQFGAWVIEPEHLLLGLLREEPALVAHFLPPNDSLAAIRRQVEERTARKDTTVPTSLELPLSPESKQVLQRAAQEAEGLSHHQIDGYHLLLGLLHEEAGLASEILRGHGLDPAIVRQTSKDRTFARPKALVPNEETAIRIAEAIWIPIFGQELIERQKPFRAKLENDVWTVRGSLPEGCTTVSVHLSPPSNKEPLPRIMLPKIQ